MNITTDQVLIFGVLVVTLVLFAWNKWRYDVVAIMALLVVALTGLVPPQEVFSGLGHPAVVTVGAVLVISIVGWRLIPQRKKQEPSTELFEIRDYLTELIVPKGCKFTGRILHELYTAIEGEAEVLVLGLIRCGQLKELPSVYEVLQEEDILLVEADSKELKRLIDSTGLGLAHGTDKLKDKEGNGLGNLHLAEVIVTSGSSLIGRTATALDLRNRYGINILAVARQGFRLRERLRRIRYVAGDILLVQAHEDALQPALNELGCLPLASRGLSFGKPRKIILAGTIFVTAIMLIVFNLIPPAIALVGASLVMLLTGVITPAEVYRSIDMSVIVLLAALLPVGQALETTGGSDLIAKTLLEISRTATPQTMLAILMIAVMLLSNMINNAAAAVLAAPIAIKLATGLQVSADPFLMAVAIGASCAFLTPIGHQSNTLVMVPGGYKFGDYWRLGLPLSILVVVISIPVIIWFWPF